jgi:type VI protein secretion system component VasK
MAQPTESWHLSKSVPISLIFALVVQAAAIVWSVSAMNSSIDNNRERIVRVETRTEKLESLVQDQAVLMARMDENIKAIRDIIERMAQKQ